MTAQLCGILKECWTAGKHIASGVPNNLIDEGKKVVNAMKKRKASGWDGIEAELWQALGENRIKAV